jgi:hypothetical protein
LSYQSYEVRWVAWAKEASVRGEGGFRLEERGLERTSVA